MNAVRDVQVADDEDENHVAALGARSRRRTVANLPQTPCRFARRHRADGTAIKRSYSLQPTDRLSLLHHYIASRRQWRTASQTNAHRSSTNMIPASTRGSRAISSPSSLPHPNNGRNSRPQRHRNMRRNVGKYGRATKSVCRCVTFDYWGGFMRCSAHRGHFLCLQRAVKDKGLEELLDQARKENPLVDPPPPPPDDGDGTPSS